MCACTEPVRTGIGAVCVEYGRPTWPITMLNHTNNPVTFFSFFFFLHPMLVRPAMKRLFCLKAKNGLGRCASSALPYYYTSGKLLHTTLHGAAAAHTCTPSLLFIVEFTDEGTSKILVNKYIPRSGCPASSSIMDNNLLQLVAYRVQAPRQANNRDERLQP